MKQGRSSVPEGVTTGRRTYRPPSIRGVSLRIHSWEDFRIEFYDWLDDFYRFPEERERMVRDGIAPLPDRRLEAFMAAAVHHLCLRYGLGVPSWVDDERNIFTFANVLERC